MSALSIDGSCSGMRLVQPSVLSYLKFLKENLKRAFIKYSYSPGTALKNEIYVGFIGNSHLNQLHLLPFFRLFVYCGTWAGSVQPSLVGHKTSLGCV